MEAVRSAIKSNVGWNGMICCQRIKRVNIGCLMDIATLTEMPNEI
jgi:hypothetical protein